MPPMTTSTMAIATIRVPARVAASDGGRERSSCPASATTMPAAIATIRTGVATSPSCVVAVGSSPTRLAMCSVCGVVAAIAIAGATSVRAIRTRPGTTANMTTSTTPNATTDPRLSLSSEVSASTTTPAAKTPRSHGGTAVDAASVSAGHSAISHRAALAFE